MSNTTVFSLVANRTAQIYGTLAGGQAPASGFTLINLDSSATVYIGNVSNVMVGASGGGIPLGPLASLTMDGSLPIYAVSDSAMQVALIPGGSTYSPGSLDISGPVTAEISGPVTVEGTVGVSGTVDAEITGTVDANITNATIDATINNSSINVVGDGGYISPGQTTLALTESSISVPNGTSAADYGEWTSDTFPISTYNSLDISLKSVVGSSDATGAAVCVGLSFTFYDSSGGTPVGYNVCWAIVGRGGSGIDTTVSVPCLGAYCIIRLINIGTAADIDISTLTVFGSYRSTPLSRFLFTGGPTDDSFAGTYGGVNFQPAVASNEYWLAGGVTGRLSTTLAASSGLTMFILGQWHGNVTGYFDIQTTALGNDPVIVDLAYETIGNIAGGINSYNFWDFANVGSAAADNDQIFNINHGPSVYGLLCNASSSSGATLVRYVGMGI